MKRSFGMWLFLSSEVLLFGALITLYLVFYYQYRPDFQLASRELHLLHGSVNTVVLLTSSFLVALGQMKNDKRWTALAALLGVLFLLIKGHEYYDLTLHGKFPLSFRAVTQEVRLFLSFYAYLTFLHSIHVILGIIALGLVLVSPRGKNGFDGLHEGVGLYWHFVDVVWVFLYPLFYLVGQ